MFGCTADLKQGAAGRRQRAAGREQETAGREREMGGETPERLRTSDCGLEERGPSWETRAEGWRGEVPEASPRDLLAQDLFERRVATLDGQNGSQDVELSHHLIGWELRPE